MFDFPYASDIIGSSNISRPALTIGAEWNVRIHETSDCTGLLRTFDETFEYYWNGKHDRLKFRFFHEIDFDAMLADIKVARRTEGGCDCGECMKHKEEARNKTRLHLARPMPLVPTTSNLLAANIAHDENLQELPQQTLPHINQEHVNFERIDFDLMKSYEETIIMTLPDGDPNLSNWPDVEAHSVNENPNAEPDPWHSASPMFPGPIDVKTILWRAVYRQMWDHAAVRAWSILYDFYCLVVRNHHDTDTVGDETGWPKREVKQLIVEWAVQAVHGGTDLEEPLMLTIMTSLIARIGDYRPYAGSLWKAWIEKWSKYPRVAQIFKDCSIS
ncbi:MAG: hypothetical protein LQ342_005664 [Letrouitia transgressa]|nr:MAG: hypothetical protein LQ342_005664 [Letrouitia transgressa]